MVVMPLFKIRWGVLTVCFCPTEGNTARRRISYQTRIQSGPVGHISVAPVAKGKVCVRSVRHFDIFLSLTSALRVLSVSIHSSLGNARGRSLKQCFSRCLR